LSATGKPGSRARRVPRQQDRARRTKNMVLDAAVAEFAAYGLAGARVDRIARRAGINKQALYYHYGSKEGLYRAALTFVYRQFQAGERVQIPAGLDPAGAMAWLVAAIFDYIRSTESATALIAYENRMHGAHLAGAVGRQIHASVTPIITAIASTLRRGQRSGVFRRDVSGVRLYLSIFAMSMFYFAHIHTLSATSGKDLRKESEIRAWKRHLVDFVLNSLAARPKKSTKRLISSSAISNVGARVARRVRKPPGRAPDRTTTGEG
jgi:TetR/AcrR family transcriptional regulator